MDGMTPSCGSLQRPGHIPPKLLAPGPSFAPDAFAPNARCKLLRSLHLYKGLHAHGTCDFWCSKPRYGHEAMQWSCSGLSKRPSCTESRAVLMLALLQNAADRVHMALAVITPPRSTPSRDLICTGPVQLIQATALCTSPQLTYHSAGFATIAKAIVGVQAKHSSIHALLAALASLALKIKQHAGNTSRLPWWLHKKKKKQATQNMRMLAMPSCSTRGCCPAWWRRPRSLLCSRSVRSLSKAQLPAKPSWTERTERAERTERTGPLLRLAALPLLSWFRGRHCRHRLGPS